MNNLDLQVVYSRRNMMEFFFIYLYRYIILGQLMNFIGILCLLRYIMNVSHGKESGGLLIPSLALLITPLFLILLSVRHKNSYEVRNIVINEESLMVKTKSVQVKCNWSDISTFIEGKTIYFVTNKDKTILIIPKQIINPAIQELFKKIKKGNTQLKTLKILFYIIATFILTVGLLKLFLH